MTSVPNADPRAALAWATETIGPITGVRRLSGGWTSTMLALTAAQGETSVLRLMDREPWRSHGPALTAREHVTLETLAGSGLPADGRHCGDPAHLMSLLPGSVQVERHDDDSLAALADLLASIHAVDPLPAVRPCESWAFEAKYLVPGWASDAATWEAAFDVLRSEPPAFAPTFIHRDFQPRNVLWDGGRISGVVDWVETSIGPAWLDVAHCLTSLVLWHGTDVADAFAAAYVDRTGCTPQPYFEVMDLVAFLPAPGRREYVVDPEERVRFEARLATVLRRLSRRTEP
jgi:aminoglycoside phosphotransferase (APT) family kinase protein